MKLQLIKKNLVILFLESDNNNLKNRNFELKKDFMIFKKEAEIKIFILIAKITKILFNNIYIINFI